jgi:hypothetical protein
MMAKFPEQNYNRGDAEGYPSGTEGVQMPAVKWTRTHAPEDGQLFKNAHGANAYLVDETLPDKPQVPLWIQEITADFSLTGNTAQSMTKRDFYAHNFTQPSFNFRGQTFNEAQYGYLTEFIRRAQVRQLLEIGNPKGDWEKRGFLRIVVPKAGFVPQRVRIRRKGKQGPVTWRRKNRSQRGERDHMIITGYIKAIQRRHERFVNAPEWNFEFITARMLAGPFSDSPVRSEKLRDIKDWTEFLRGDGFVKDPDSGKDEDKPKWRPPSFWGDDNDTDIDYDPNLFEEVFNTGKPINNPFD